MQTDQPTRHHQRVIRTHIRTTALLCAAVIVALLSACGGGSSPAGQSSTAKPTPTAPPTPTPIPPLNAPAIVQVENLPQARPDSGLGTADVVYEYSAEGGIGRFSLLFFNDPAAAQRVGPVRSARTVTVQLAHLYQGFLAYSGADIYVQGLIDNAAFPAYDEDHAQGNLFRTGDRAPPHNLYTDGSHLAKLRSIAGLGPVGWRLWGRSTTGAVAGKALTSFTVPISDFEQPTFTWDAAAGGFTRREETGPVREAGTGAPLVVPTVIVQQVQVTTDPNVVDVNGSLGLDHRITGSGSAQIFTAGHELDATWTQGDSGPPQFTLATGGSAPIAPGEVWICLVPTGQPASIR